MPCIPWDTSACLQVLRTPSIPLKLRCRIEVSGANAQWVVFITYFEWSLSFFPGEFTPTWPSPLASAPFMHLEGCTQLCGSAGKESACSVGDLGSIPGLERSPGEGKGYPLQYSGLENSMDESMGSQRVRHQLGDFHFCTVLLVAQTVKCLHAMWETWVWSLGGEDPLEQEMAAHSSTLAWKIPWTEEPGRLQAMGSQRVRHDWVTLLSLSQFCSSPSPLNYSY